MRSGDHCQIFCRLPVRFVRDRKPAASSWVYQPKQGAIVAIAAATPTTARATNKTLSLRDVNDFIMAS
jgi:hypothetical protein